MTLDIKMWNVRVCCLVLGVLLLAASVTHVRGENDIYAEGQWVTFETALKDPTTGCQLTLPNGEVCFYVPGSSTTSSPNKICRFSSLPNFGCRFEVHITNKTLSGVYTLNYNVTGLTEEEEKFNVYLPTGSVPEKEVTVVENETLYLKLKDLFGTDVDRKCEAAYSNETDTYVLDPTWLSQNRWGEEDECGFKLESVSISDATNWTLRMSSNGAPFTYAEFTVNVIPLDEFDIGEQHSEIWWVGKEGMLSNLTYPHSKYCELLNPKKEKVTIESGCNYTQKIVTDADEGDWTFVFGIEGKLMEDTIDKKIIVKKGNFKTNVSDPEWVGNGKSLLCTLYPGPVEDCRFTRPDGKVILPSEGIGNADYSYFGDGFLKGDCGLTIHNVQDMDKGMWNCTVSDGSTQRSGFLNVSASELKPEPYNSTVVVQQGSELSLSCSAQTALDYCWFRHPSGLPLRFTTNLTYLDGFGRQYKYEDTLQLGMCTIKLPYPYSSQDSGKWTCYLGSLGSSNEEYTVPITVGVSETDVISLKKEVVVSEDSAVLKCYSVPMEIPLDYCRFIRPDGKGFNIVPQKYPVLGKYQYAGDGLEKGECGLSVSGINVTEDLGKWKCVARLQGRKNEGHDYITLKAEVPVFKVGSNGMVVVKKDSELSFSCSADTPLDYCWFRHPSGLPLRFSTNLADLDDNGRKYLYEDTLQKGVCTIKLLTPSIDEDSGEWTCNLESQTGPIEEYTIPITVGVSETDVISLDKEVVVSNDTALLICYSVPMEIPLDYCRFVRPDGKGFVVATQNNSNTAQGKYRYEADGLAKGECGLRIVSEINVDEDLGKWKCVARLQGRTSEGYDSITLIPEGGWSAGAIVETMLGSVALLIVTGGIAFLI